MTTERNAYQEDKPITPTSEQISNCEVMGWEYVGDGLFFKEHTIGWFTVNGWETD